MKPFILHKEMDAGRLDKNSLVAGARVNNDQLAQTGKASTAL